MKLKKIYYLISSMLIISCFASYASNHKTQMNSETSVIVDLEFELTIDDYTDLGGRPRTAPLYPQASVDDHSIYLTSGCAKTELRIIDYTGHTIFSSTIQNDDEEINLPLNISGATTVQIV